MNDATADQIIALNKRFYEQVGDDFNRTRNSPWKGWDQLIPYLKGQKFISVLDIACGNGRFAKFLKQYLLSENFSYLGLDSDEKLLRYAQSQGSKNMKFEVMDVINDFQNVKGSFDLVVAFGITHHIPSQKLRTKWFKDIAEKVEPRGLLIFTIWNYPKSDRFAKSFRPVPQEINQNELEPGDYFIGWGDTDAVRYVHEYSEEEIRTMIKSNDLHIERTFKADGKSEDLNTYYILRS